MKVLEKLAFLIFNIFLKLHPLRNFLNRALKKTVNLKISQRKGVVCAGQCGNEQGAYPVGIRSKALKDDAIHIIRHSHRRTLYT